MHALQIIFTALIAFWMDSFYLKASSIERISPQYAPRHVLPVIGDPFLFALAVVASLWFVCSVGMLSHRRWAYYGCVVPHVLVFLCGGFLTFAGLLAGPAKRYDIIAPILATFFGAPFFVISGGCLFWLFTRRTRLLSTSPPGA